MRIPIPKTLDPRQQDDDTRGLVLAAPSVSAPSTDDRATAVTLGDHEHRIPAGWDIAEARSGAYSLALLRRGAEVKVLVGTIDHGVREVAGYRQDVRRSILEHRFGEPSQQSSDQREVDRLVALSDSLAPGSSTSSDDDEVARLVALSDDL